MKVCFPCLFPCRRNPIPIHRNTSGPVPARPARTWTVSRCATRPETFSTASTSRKSVPTSASAFRPQPAVHPGQPIDLPPVSEGNRDTTALGLPPLSARFRGQDGNHGTRGTTRVLELFRQFKKLRRSQPSWGGRDGATRPTPAPRIPRRAGCARGRARKPGWPSWATP